MLKLNLPEFDYKIQNVEGKVWIFDVIRKKFVVLTPEEWVRQHFINYLVQELKYPKSLISVESGLKYNQLQKRSDIIVYDREGNPWMVIECKSPEQKLNQQTLRQVSVYNATMKAKYISITNGIIHLCSEVNWTNQKVSSLKSFPQYPVKG